MLPTWKIVAGLLERMGYGQSEKPNITGEMVDEPISGLIK
jgi:hypothetical protein